MEVRSAAGGDEAALFASEITRMLTKYAERLRYKVEVLTTNESPLGGLKEIIFEVKGRGAYGVFKYESGVHRVQRVPVTESTGRIHTSTATVAVLPEARGGRGHHRPQRAAHRRLPLHGAGRPVGEHHRLGGPHHPLPTGLVVSCQDEKSQLQNKERALRILRARLFDAAQAEKDAKEATLRRSQVGTGDRAQKIRTYNFPQGRVTDHRIGLTSHRMEGILEGELEEFTEALIAQDRADQFDAARP